MQETNKDVPTVVLWKMYCLVLYVNLVKNHSNFNQSGGNLLSRKLISKEKKFISRNSNHGDHKNQRVNYFVSRIMCFSM